MNTFINSSFGRIAALRGTRYLAYLKDMSRCSVPCALRSIPKS
ncbi:MAG: hypothetical protein PXX77_11220 [Gallionella sp.]|nr:hypothetical protein [Gallionella sp.]